MTKFEISELMFCSFVEVIVMYDYNQCQNRDVLCIDLKSFFASVSCIRKGLDPMKTKLADEKSLDLVKREKDKKLF